MFTYRFFEWETVKKGKKQPYYIYFKGDGIVKPKEEGNVSEDDTEEKELASMKKDDTAKWGDKRLLTMAGLFDHWKAPKVCIFYYIF